VRPDAFDDDLLALLDIITPEDRLVLYGDGNLAVANNVAARLGQRGYANVELLRGGLAAWREPGLLLVAIYGGYFNGGLGILLMALYTVTGEGRIHTVNALKNLNSLVLSWLAVGAFVLAGAIAWKEGLLMMVAATAGGFLGARWSKRLPASWVRWGVIVTGLVMSALFFARGA
ncbi:MAG: TSUP family transporter, partial [Hydrogenophaga sp.]|nr:TSUP family transporter [Hydrogenophaga sp.]